MIKNLPNRLNEAGRIKIGVKGQEITSKEGNVFRPPQKLDYFLLTTTERDETTGDFVHDVKLMDELKGNGGLVNSAGNLVGIPIRLLYEDINLNFPTRYVSYVSGKLSCTGDGEFSTKRLDDFKKTYSCPCERLGSEYTGKDKCKASGKLTVIIDNANLFGQCHVFRTTSINSVMGIMGGLNLIRTATKGHVAGIPLMLVLNNKTTTIPGVGTTTTVQVVSVCYRGSMEDLRNDTIKLIQEDKQFLIGMTQLEKEAYALNQDMVITPDEEKDFIEEFMPDARDMAATTTTTTVIKEEEKPIDAVECEKPEAVEVVVVEEKKPVLSKEEGGLLLDRIVNCDDIDLSISLIQQLQKPAVIQYLKTYFPETVFKESEVKAVLVGMAIDLTKQMFNVIEETPENTDAPVVEHETVATEKEPTITAYSFDDGPAITRELKIEIVKLKKNEFEKNVENHESEWSKMVGMFLNKDGAPLRSAVDMTQNQALIFIKLVNDCLTGQIPF